MRARAPCILKYVQTDTARIQNMVPHITATLFPIFGIIFLGMFVARGNLLPPSMARSINQFVYWIAFPAMMFNYLAVMDTSAISRAYFLGVYASFILSYLVCLYTTSGGFRDRSAGSAMLSYLSCFPNAAFMGAATVSFLLPGDSEAMATVGLCVVLYTPVMLYTDTRLEMDRHKGKPWRLVLAPLGLSVLRNPMLMASLAGIAVSLSPFDAPVPLMNMAGMLGATTAPCALFAMGMVLAEQLSSRRRPERGWISRQLPVHVVKLLLFPLLTFAALRLFDVSGILLGVTTLIAGMPIGVVAYVLAEKFQVSVEDTSTAILLNTALSIISIPLTIAALYRLGVFGPS